jgi:hypothetical protein
MTKAAMLAAMLAAVGCDSTWLDLGDDGEGEALDVPGDGDDAGDDGAPDDLAPDVLDADALPDAEADTNAGE